MFKGKGLPLKTPFGQQKKGHLPALSLFLLQGIFYFVVSFQSVNHYAFGRLEFFLKLFTKKTTLGAFQSFFFAPIFTKNNILLGEAAPRPQRIHFKICFTRGKSTTKKPILK
jgi:hypothetical protein